MLGHLVSGRYGAGGEAPILAAPPLFGWMRYLLGALVRLF